MNDLTPFDVEVPVGAKFRVAGLTTIPDPHPYCITDKHVCYASDKCGGILGESAIEGAERSGAWCGIRDCNLKYSEHRQSKVLVVVIAENIEIMKKDEEMRKFFMGIKDRLEKEKIAGILLPTEEEFARK